MSCPPHPASMFNNTGQMREAKTKSTLKNALKAESSARHANIDVSFLDGCALLWTVQWPSSGSVQAFLNNFRHHVLSYLQTSEVYLVFDRLVYISVMIYNSLTGPILYRETAYGPDPCSQARISWRIEK